MNYNEIFHISLLSECNLKMLYRYGGQNNIYERPMHVGY